MPSETSDRLSHPRSPPSVLRPRSGPTRLQALSLLKLQPSRTEQCQPPETTSPFGAVWSGTRPRFISGRHPRGREGDVQALSPTTTLCVPKTKHTPLAIRYNPPCRRTPRSVHFRAAHLASAAPITYVGDTPSRNQCCSVENRRVVMCLPVIRPQLDLMEL